jgi:exosome complex component RRP41
MALADAGIPMRDAVASCAVGYLQSTALLDLNYMEDSGGGPDVSVAVHPNMDRLVLLQMDGKLPPEVFEECVALAAEGCKAVASVMRTELLKHTKRLAITTGIVGVQ